MTSTVEPDAAQGSHANIAPDVSGLAVGWRSAIHSDFA
jgi:hypothetical protein